MSTNYANGEVAYRTAVRATRLRNFGIRATSVLVVLAVWEIVGHITPEIFLSPFHETLIAFFVLTADGSLPKAAASSLMVLGVGLLVSAVGGIIIGLLMGRYQRAAWVMEPYVNGLYAAPTIAFLPILTLWFGLYFAPEIAIVVLIAIFPILKNTYSGVATVSHEYLEPAESMKATEYQVFVNIIMPAILPFIMAGLRLAVGRAVVGVVVGEFFTVQSGLGGMVVRYASGFRTAEMFVPILLLVGIGMGLTALIGYVQKKLAPWKESERDQGM